ncbi:MAG: hypothetical protein AABW46_00820 [Nanoarchaeota archaeon]
MTELNLQKRVDDLLVSTVRIDSSRYHTIVFDLTKNKGIMEQRYYGNLDTAMSGHQAILDEIIRSPDGYRSRFSSNTLKI